MLRLLVKKQLMEINASFFINKKNGKKKSKTSTILSIVGFGLVMIGILGGIFTGLSNLLCVPFCSLGLDWLYFVYMALIAIVLGIFGSVFNTYASLYQAKDNEMLMVFPIPVRTILCSRLVSVYLMGLMYSGVVFIPAILIHAIHYGISLGPIVMLVNISLIVFVLSCVLGYGVAQIAAHTKNRSAITVLASLGFIAAYYYVYFKAVNSMEEILSNPELLAKGVQGIVPLIIFGKAGTGDIGSMCIVTMLSMGLTILSYLILEHNFFTLVQKSKIRVVSTKKVKNTVQKSVSQALLTKEFGRFTSSANYMLNCGLGSLVLVILGIVFLFKGQYAMEILKEVFKMENIESLAFIASTCMAIGMIDITAPSISLEGKNIWILKSLPVDTWQVLLAKLKVQWYVSGIPFFFAWICFLFVAKLNVFMMGMTLIIPVAFIVVNSCVGLVINLIKPNLTWVDEINVIKQSLGVLFTMLINVIFILVMAGLYFIIGYQFSVIYLLIWMIFFIGLSIGLFVWLKNKGVRCFEQL